MSGGVDDGGRLGWNTTLQTFIVPGSMPVSSKSRTEVAYMYAHAVFLHNLVITPPVPDGLRAIVPVMGVGCLVIHMC